MAPGFQMGLKHDLVDAKRLAEEIGAEAFNGCAASPCGLGHELQIILQSLAWQSPSDCQRTVKIGFVDGASHTDHVA